MPPRKASSSSSKPRTAKTTTAIASTAPPSQSDMPSTEAHLGLIIECLTFNPRIYIDGLTHLATEGVYELGLELEKSILAILKEKGVADAEQEAERVSIRELRGGYIKPLIDADVRLFHYREHTR